MHKNHLPSPGEVSDQSSSSNVVPANAGTRTSLLRTRRSVTWMPAFAGMTLLAVVAAAAALIPSGTWAQGAHGDLADRLTPTQLTAYEA